MVAGLVASNVSVSTRLVYLALPLLDDVFREIFGHDVQVELLSFSRKGLFEKGSIVAAISRN